MNYLDSARLAACLIRAGHEQVENEGDAEVILVNSCTVTHGADRDSRKAALKVEKMKKQLVFFGCGPKVEKMKWEEVFPESLVFSSERDLLTHFGAAEEAEELPMIGRTRLPIAIQRGCDNTCTFCITRIARGKHESISKENIIQQVKNAEKAGIKEVVLTGINLAAWGSLNSNNPSEACFGKLLQTILEQTSIPRIRISSIGPQFIHEDFWEAYKDPRICDYLHISIQAGSDTVLQKMNRGHGTKEIEYIAQQARKIRPDTALAADIIVGFPGETEELFEETFQFIKNIQLAKIHIFPFSAREGTPAATMKEQVAEDVKKDRAARLRDLGDELHQNFIQSQIDKEKDVLTELGGYGLTSNYIRVKTPNIGRNEVLLVVLTKENIENM